MKTLTLFCFVFCFLGATAQALTPFCDRRHEIVGAVEDVLQKKCPGISDAEIYTLKQVKIYFDSKSLPLSADDLAGFRSLKELSVIQTFHNDENTDAFILTRDTLRSTPNLEYLYTNWTPEDHASFKEALSYVPKLKELWMKDQDFSQIRFRIQESDFAGNPELEVLELSLGRKDSPIKIQGDLFNGNPRLAQIQFDLQARKVQFGANFRSLDPNTRLYFQSHGDGLSFEPNAFRDVHLRSLEIGNMVPLNSGLFHGARIGEINFVNFKPELISKETFEGMEFLGKLTLDMFYYAPQGGWVFPENFFTRLRFAEGLAIRMSSPNAEWRPNPDFLLGFDRLRELSLPGQTYQFVGPENLFNQLSKLEFLHYDAYYGGTQSLPVREFRRDLGISCFSPGAPLAVGARCKEDRSVYAGTVLGKRIFSTPSNCKGSGCSGGIPIETIDESSATWDGAKSFCQSLKFGGHQDWRLPKIDELNVIYENQEAIGGFNQGNAEVSWGIYWSSDSTENYPDLAKIVMFSGTPPVNSNWSKNRLGFYRCVRSGDQ